MPFFSYKGRDSKGTLVQGVLESADSSSLANQLFNLNITPIEIKVQTSPAASKNLSISLFDEKIETIDVMLFSRQMYTLLKAGIPIMNAFNGLEASTQNKAFASVIASLRQSLASGRELSNALSQHPKVFSNFYISMIRVGESTGMLETVFLRLFDHLEFERFMRDQIKAALRYPTFVVIAMGIAIVVVNLFVIPAFAKVFQGFGAELPLMTKILLAFSNFMVASWPYLIAGIIAMVWLFRTYTASGTGQYHWDSFKLKTPIAGKIIHKATMARFARSFALASKSGVPITSSLKLVAQTTDNVYIANQVEQMREGVERGESILRTATNAGVFNPIVLQMIAVGEEGGRLEEVLTEIASSYTQESETILKIITSLIEPLVILCLGLILGLIIMAMLLPIFQINMLIR